MEEKDRGLGPCAKPKAGTSRQGWSLLPASIFFLKVGQEPQQAVERGQDE